MAANKSEEITKREKKMIDFKIEKQTISLKDQITKFEMISRLVNIVVNLQCGRNWLYRGVMTEEDS